MRRGRTSAKFGKLPLWRRALLAAQIGLALTALVVLCFSYFRLQRDVRKLRQTFHSNAEKLGQTERELERVESGVESLDREHDQRLGRVESELRKDLFQLDKRFSGKLGTLSQQFDTSFDSLQTSFRLTSASALSTSALYDKLLLPSVKVKAGTGIGGGTVIYSKPSAGERGCDTYVLTAYHVVSHAIRRGGDSEERNPVRVWYYEGIGEQGREAEATIISYDSRLDVAVLRLEDREDREPFAHVASLLPAGGTRKLEIFRRVYAIGCPLGHDPIPTSGQIASFRKEVNGQNFWLFSAPTIFGNSGGGIFLEESGEMIGVSNMVCVYEDFFSMPVAHLGVMIPMDEIYGWLSSQRMEFLYDSSVSKTSCDRARRKLRKEAPKSVELTWSME